MKAQRLDLKNPRIRAAITELQSLIAKRFPGASFETIQGLGDDIEGIYLMTTIDIDDPDEVVDAIIDRLVELQVEEGLPVHVLAVRTPERIARELASRARPAGSPAASPS